MQKMKVKKYPYVEIRLPGREVPCLGLSPCWNLFEPEGWIWRREGITSNWLGKQIKFYLFFF
jgi:hypothetical protein